MDYIPYNSRNRIHKNKFGAVKNAEDIEFKVVLPRHLRCSCVCLALKRDGFDYEYIPMNWLSMEGDSEEWWALRYTAGEPDIYFYHFILDTPWGNMTIRHNGNCLGLLSTGTLDWQLTVYDRNFSTPDWLKGGIFYQIFPDRFNCSGKLKDGIPEDRILREDRDGEPYWRPTAEGKVLNNDYFQGDLQGITEKLGYLSELGVTCIYLNPIFEANSNHRYDTADYTKIDPLLGDEADFAELCRKAEKFGISIILDGVFSHTGDDSKYFNKYGRYADLGAYQSKDSPYYSWYKFNEYPDKYHSWWGIDILPEVNEDDPGFIEYIAGKDGIARKWLKLGARGWRLDVADELPDVFLDEFRKAVKNEKSDALVLGEVWEDASNKFSYGQRRRYFSGRQLDSVMNYPFADAVVEFIRSGVVEGFSDKILTIVENYPKCCIDVLMNHIGTHDTMRILTHLAGEDCEYRDRSWQSEKHLSEDEYLKGIKLLKLASVLQFTLPGVPCIYYGDEVGMEGYKDPFNRCFYPWGKENKELLEHYIALGRLRHSCDCFREGEFVTVSEMQGCLAFVRIGKKDSVFVVVNRNEHPIDYYLPDDWHGAESVFGGLNNGYSVKLDALDASVLRKENI